MGPFNFEELSKEYIKPETLVWFPGLQEWRAAREIEELGSLFSGNGEPAPPPVPDSQNGSLFTENRESSSSSVPELQNGSLFTENQQPAPLPVPDAQNVGKTPVQPKSWLAESILATIFCCLPFGIAGIVYASKVENRFVAGDIQGSQEASKQAARWTKYSFIAGIIYIAIALIYGISTGFSGY